jgi:hypothetical protein
VCRPRSARRYLRWEQPGSVSDLLFELFATDLYFLFCDDVDNSPRERGPFLFQLLYGPVRNEIYRLLTLRSLVPHPVQPNGQFARHRRLATKLAAGLMDGMKRRTEMLPVSGFNDRKELLPFFQGEYREL